MGIFAELSDNVTEIGVMAVTVVLISLLLNNFKTSAFVCTNTTHAYYNSTLDQCCLGTATTITNCNGAANLTSINTVGSSINTSLTGIGTPITYITIIILVVVFTAILIMLVTKIRDRM